MAKQKSFHYAWIILVALAIIRGIAGPALNASAGLFLKPVADDIGVGIGDLSLYLSISSIIMVFWLPIAGKLINKYNIKIVTILAALLQAGSFFAFGFMKSVWGWYLLSIPTALGSALLVNLLGPVLINRWYVKNKGVAMGLMMSLVGLLGAFFQPTITSLLTHSGWQHTYKLIGLASLIIIILVAVFLLKNAPQDKNLQAYGYKTGETSAPSNTAEPLGISARIAMKSSSFYLLTLFIIVLTSFAAFSQHITTFGLTLGHSMSTVGMALSLSMIGSAIGAILIGIFSDKFGALKVSIAVLIIGMMAIILYLIGGNYFVTFALATFLHGLASSSIGVLAPLLTSTFFGNKDYEKLFATVMMGAPLASIVLLPAYGFIYDTFGSYQIVFAFLLIALTIGLLSLILGFKKSHKLFRNL